MKPGLIGYRRSRRTGIRKKNNLANVPIPTAAIAVVSVSVADDVLTMEFNQHVYVAGTPKITTDVAGATVTGAASITPTVVEITFSESIAAATIVNVPYEEKSIRNASGGFIATSTFPV